jgi:hypothetical protein
MGLDDFDSSSLSVWTTLMMMVMMIIKMVSPKP